MDTLYDVLIDLAKEHRKICLHGKSGGYSDMFRFNLSEKSIENGQIYLMKSGEVCMDHIETSDGKWYDLIGLPLIKDTCCDFYLEIERLYHVFNNSVPTKYDNICRNNFKAKHSDELSFDQIMHNARRPVARYKLEAFIMFYALLNRIPWNDQNYFFWQSQKERQLILFKSWCAA